LLRCKGWVRQGGRGRLARGSKSESDIVKFRSPTRVILEDEIFAVLKKEGTKKGRGGGKPRDGGG